jgi:prepilin-type N-terminal cleavage/methylation domain-containing protein
VRTGIWTDSGFTFVELMVVVLVIGILMSIVVPQYFNVIANASARTCQANQRIIASAVQISQAAKADTSGVGIANSVLDSNVGWGKVLLPTYIKSVPRCPETHAVYYMSPEGTVLGDQGDGPQAFVNQGQANDHQLQ